MLYARPSSALALMRITIEHAPSHILPTLPPGLLRATAAARDMQARRGPLHLPARRLLKFPLSSHLPGTQ